MRLRIVTPFQIVVDEDRVRALRAEDASGSVRRPARPRRFPHQPRHLRGELDQRRRRATLLRGAARRPFRHRRPGRRHRQPRGDRRATISRGSTETVLERFRAESEIERQEHVESTRLQLVAIRQIMRRLRPDGTRSADGARMTPREPEPDERDPLVSNVRLRGERRRKSLREGEPSVARRLAQIGVLGWIIVTPMLIGVFVGRWLDHVFNSGDILDAPRC